MTQSGAVFGSAQHVMTLRVEPYSGNAAQIFVTSVSAVSCLRAVSLPSIYICSDFMGTAPLRYAKLAVVESIAPSIIIFGRGVAISLSLGRDLTVSKKLAVSDLSEQNCKSTLRARPSSLYRRIMRIGMREPGKVTKRDAYEIIWKLGEAIQAVKWNHA